VSIYDISVKKIILPPLVLLALIGSVPAQSVTYSSTPTYQEVPVTSTVDTNASFSANYNSGFYDTTISYPALPSGTLFNIYTTDTFHVYGPYSTSDSWSVPYNNSDVSVQATLNSSSSGGSFILDTLQPITSITYQLTTTMMEEQLQGYQTSFYYGSLSAGTVLNIYTTDTFHVYGPYSTPDSWNVPYNNSDVSVQATLNSSSSGGSFILDTAQPITAANISPAPEPSIYILFGIGALALIVAYRRKVA